jgi:hypothetical protein
MNILVQLICVLSCSEMFCAGKPQAIAFGQRPAMELLASSKALLLKF